jgi:RNA polymerase sigma-70 factor (ECF subfamily)
LPKHNRSAGNGTETPPAGEVTLLLRQLKSGDRSKLDHLLELAYPSLRRLANHQFRAERFGHVLQPTALVNEAYLRIVAHRDQAWDSRAHFFGAVAQLMRRILIEHARNVQALKRGGRDCTISLHDIDVSGSQPSIEFLALDEALTGLEKVSSRQARIVEMRYFAGMSVPEVAEALGIDPRTVDRDWATARAWLRRRLLP